MKGPFWLALKYVAYNRWKFCVLVACVFLTAFLPITIKLLLNQFSQKILARGASTPLVVGAVGSDLDLTLNTIYYHAKSPGEIPFREVRQIRESKLATAIPIMSRFTASGFPIVGTTLDYLTFRELEFKSGESFAMLGDCVVGASVAERMQVSVGDQIFSDRKNAFDIAGLGPLKMLVTGVMAPVGTPDDEAVFVDLRTAWVIAGLGHGHQDLANETDELKVLSREKNAIVASAAVVPYMEVTDENRDSFHFHGDTDDFPLTAIIAVPVDEKSSTLLQGHYVDGIDEFQIVRPIEVIENLMSMIFRVKRFFDANAILIAVSTVLLLGLVVMLSLQLRRREMQTMFKIGCNRSTMMLMQFWEMIIVFLVASILVAVTTWVVGYFGEDWIVSYFVQSR